MIVGLAPAAHGGNRTGRVFTGDRSGDWLFAALHRVGLASLPTSEDAGDGLRLDGVRIVAPVRCAPPANRPTPGERDTCSPWLDREVALVMPTCVPWWRSDHSPGRRRWATLERNGVARPGPAPDSATAPRSSLERQRPTGVLIGCYHPSQQNTFTGKLTERMLDDILRRAAAR